MSDTPEILPQKPRKSREANRLEWAERLARFDSSGLAVLDFCRAENVASPSFYQWKRRLAACAEPPSAAPEFLPIRLAPSTPVEIVLPNGAALRLSPGCDLAFVRSLVQALAGSGPC
jgi:transposase